VQRKRAAERQSDDVDPDESPLRFIERALCGGASAGPSTENPFAWIRSESARTSNGLPVKPWNASTPAPPSPSAIGSPPSMYLRCTDRCGIAERSSAFSLIAHGLVWYCRAQLGLSPQ